MRRHGGNSRGIEEYGGGSLRTTARYGNLTSAPSQSFSYLEAKTAENESSREAGISNFEVGRYVGRLWQQRTIRSIEKLDGGGGK